MRSFSELELIYKDVLTVLDHDPQEERLIQVEDEQHPEETDAVLLMEGLHFPVEVAKGIFEESSNILECSPLLCHITGLSCGHNKLSEITISLLCEGSNVGIRCANRNTCQSCQLSR
jgi:hypothetical protein